MRLDGNESEVETLFIDYLLVNTTALRLLITVTKTLYRELEITALESSQYSK